MLDPYYIFLGKFIAGGFDDYCSMDMSIFRRDIRCSNFLCRHQLQYNTLPQVPVPPNTPKYAYGPVQLHFVSVITIILHCHSTCSTPFLNLFS